MWLILISVTLASLLIWDYLFKRHRNRLMNSTGIPGPKNTWPLIGDALVLIGNDTKSPGILGSKHTQHIGDALVVIGNDIINVFSLLCRLGLEFGKVFRLWIGHRLLVVVTDPKIFEVILSSQHTLKKIFVYDMFSCWLGDGLLLSFGSKWHARRKILTPTYHFKILDDFVEVFDRQSGIFVERLHKLADGKTVINIFPIVCLMALDIIAETAMGVTINAQEHPDFPYANAVTTVTDIIATRAMKPVQYYDIGFILTAFPSYLKLKKNIKIMHNFTNKVINDRRATLKNTVGSSISSDKASKEVGQKTRMAFLDVLLQAAIDGKPLGQEDIRAEVDTFMFEGHDTTTSAISFCLYLLARHADIQQKVFEEILELIGNDKDKPITMRDLQDLKYLEIVIKESLRLYPSVPIIGRHTEKDIRVDDQIIPSNTHVILLLYAAGHDPDYFDKPNDFIPERYYSEQEDKKTLFANIPFSAGPRNCIGQKFAMLEMKSSISKVIRHFELLPLGPDVIPVLNLILRSSTGMSLGLKPRKY